MAVAEDHQTAGAVDPSTEPAGTVRPVRPGGGQSWRQCETNRGPVGPAVLLDAQLRECRSGFGTVPRQRVVARVCHLRRGRFDPTAIVEDPVDSFGLLMLDGLIAVDLGVGRAQVSWLVGADDLIRPWDMHEISLTADSSWHVLTSARVALLDGEFSRRAGRSPEVARALVERATQTSHWLLAESLIMSAPVVEERLLLMFALLAERWGKVRPEGVWLELPLTHDLLARLSGSRRPSVTTALRSLDDAGIVERVDRGCWLLHQAPG